MTSRLSLSDSWDLLDADDNDEEMPRNPDGSPKLPAKRPQAGKPGFGSIEMYKSGWKDADMRNLTVPRCFFARSLFEQVLLTNTDLTESWLCWNNFEYCDFSEAVLTQCDMRCSYWLDCSFDDANLTGADLRGSDFVNCTFDGAIFKDALVLPRDVLLEQLSEAQKAGIVLKRRGGQPHDGCIY
ncbi:MAG: pentapeptide repeat-containing protein [Armatimonas sp.]